MKNVRFCVNCTYCQIDRIAYSWCTKHRKIVDLNNKCVWFTLKVEEDEQ